MPITEAHVGDAGTIIQYTLTDGGDVLDCSLATAMDLVIVDSKGTRTIIAGSFETDGTDGIINFVSDGKTWRNGGQSREQVQITFPSGKWSGKISERFIGERL